MSPTIATAPSFRESLGWGVWGGDNKAQWSSSTDSVELRVWKTKSFTQKRRCTERIPEIFRSFLGIHQWMHSKKLPENGELPNKIGVTNAQVQTWPRIVPPPIKPGKYVNHKILGKVLRRILCQLWRKNSFRLHAALDCKTKLKINIQKDCCLHVT